MAATNLSKRTHSWVPCKVIECEYQKIGFCKKAERCPFFHGIFDRRKPPNLTKTQICPKIKHLINNSFSVDLTIKTENSKEILIENEINSDNEAMADYEGCIYICGDSTCQFAHSKGELRKPPNKSVLCRAWLIQGNCPYLDCHYAHCFEEVTTELLYPEFNGVPPPPIVQKSISNEEMLVESQNKINKNLSSKYSDLDLDYKCELVYNDLKKLNNSISFDNMAKLEWPKEKEFLKLSENYNNEFSPNTFISSKNLSWSPNSMLSTNSLQKCVKNSPTFSTFVDENYENYLNKEETFDLCELSTCHYTVFSPTAEDSMSNECENIYYNSNEITNFNNIQDTYLGYQNSSYENLQICNDVTSIGEQFHINHISDSIEQNICNNYFNLYPAPQYINAPPALATYNAIDSIIHFNSMIGKEQTAQVLQNVFVHPYYYCN